MNISIVGHSGMLGKRVVEEARYRNHNVYESSIRFPNHIGGDDVMADAIINCAGIIPPRGYDEISMLKINSLGPWQLAQMCNHAKVHLVHMSTDCVFSGKSGGLHSKSALPDPTDIYGRSKLAGEPSGDYVTVARGSFIGLDHGFVRWLLDAEDSIEIWTNAIWNGGSVWAMARALVDLAERDPQGLVHVAARREMSKAQMALYLIRECGLKIPNVLSVDIPYIWRKLEPDVFLPRVEESLDEVVKHLRNG